MVKIAGGSLKLTSSLTLSLHVRHICSILPDFLSTPSSLPYYVWEGGGGEAGDGVGGANYKGCIGLIAGDD